MTIIHSESVGIPTPVEIEGTATGAATRKPGVVPPEHAVTALVSSGLMLPR